MGVLAGTMVGVDLLVTDAECTDFLQWALPRMGLRWAGFRRVRRQVRRRLARRLARLGLPDADSYRARLQVHPEEWAALDGLCRITISRFWRDRAVFTRLEETVLPCLARRASADGRPVLRAWSAGCASGEEPYSLSLLWDLAVAPRFPGLTLEIVATDTEPALLARAARARYRGGSLREVPEGWREAGFQETEAGFILRERLRRRVILRRQDVRRAAPEGLFGLILCRNLAFTYFDADTQRAVLRSLQARLEPGGYLIIGSHESLPRGGEGLEPLSRSRCLFQSREHRPGHDATAISRSSRP